jgi:Mg2+ and Co2+ transporter CorA
MIFLLMRAVMKEQQAEVKEMTKELRGKKDKFETEKVGLRAAVDKADKAVMEAQARFNKNPGDESAAKGLADARANLRAAEAALNDKTTEFNDSRAEQLEVIKNAMQKLTEMQQALSNILNTMHQTAMNTIGNIR